MRFRLVLLGGILLIFFLVAIYVPTQKSAPCSKHIMSAATQMVQEDFSPFPKFFIKTKNDILCEPGESMANIVLYVEKKSGERYYGIFHIHFSSDTGALNSEGPEIRWKYNWKPLKDGTEWKTDWCNFIRHSYRHEMKRHQCR